MVRASIQINPYTAQVTVISDPFPTIIDGVPLQIKHVNVNINRPEFMFNPTSCEPMTITGTVGGWEGASSAVSSPFRVAGCKNLAFKPTFAVSTQGKTSKANGASLTVKIVPPAEGPQTTGTSASGSTASRQTEANIAKAKVELPKQLPSRLTTLQKACTAAVFAADPANCPTASIVGDAVVHTPILSVPLQGPAIFVSHGNEAFPQLIIILQGEGITIQLVGDTFISKSGVTSSTFNAIPDAPVSSFELTLPTGPYSALAANLPKGKYDFCGQKLTMPTEFTGQNGAVIHQNTPIAVTGCPKAKTLTKSQQLAKALKACHKDKNKSKRAKCEASARKKFGPVKKKAKKK